jgi:hypothetical protein
LLDLALDVGELLLQRLQHTLDARQQSFVGVAVLSLPLGRHHRHDLASASHEIAELARRLVRHRPDGGLGRLDEVSDDAGVLSLAWLSAAGALFDRAGDQSCEERAEVGNKGASNSV